MIGAWPASLDQLWRSPAFPMWLTLAAAAFFGLLMLITLARAERSVANGALTVIALLAVGIAVAATIRGYGPATTRGASNEARPEPAEAMALPSLACLDDLAGDAVLGVCEKAVFASPQSTAAAVSYVAAQISRLMSYGDAASASKSMTPELQSLRRSIEHDRYGIVAQVLQVRHHCTPTECAVFRALTDNHQIITNMDEHLYEGLVNRYAALWTAAPPPASASTAPGMGALAAYPPSIPTGKPTSIDFPSSNSIPPVSIMSSEPARAAAAPPTAAAPATRSVASPPPSPSPAAKKSAAKPPPRPAPAPAPAAQPAQISPSPSAPAASND